MTALTSVVRSSVESARDARLSDVFVIHGTKKLRNRIKTTTTAPVKQSTTALGSWYATALFWRPHVALLVNESTLLPVLMPLAPAATVLDRFPIALADVLRKHRIDDWFVEREVAEMSEWHLVPTTNRSIVGVMNDFAHLAGEYAASGGDDLVSLSLRLSRTPSGPLYGRHGSPDRELAALVAERGTRSERASSRRDRGTRA
jgi:Domain of unknown function (DUF6933)